MASLCFQRLAVLAALAILPILWMLWRRACRRVDHACAVLLDGQDTAGLEMRKLRRANLLRGALRTAAMGALIVGVSGPSLAQPGALGRASVPVVFVVDVSASMAAADVTPHRLGAARQAVAHIASLMPASRTALVAVAEDAAVVCPLTDDREAFLTLLAQVSTDLMSAGGTHLAAGAEQAERLIERDAGAGVVVLVSDGEDHEEPPSLPDRLKRMRREGILTHTVTVGTAEGAALEGVLALERPGEAVVSKARPEQMSDWAAAGGGRAWAVRLNGLSGLPSGAEQVVSSRLATLAATKQGMLRSLSVYCYLAAAVLLAAERLLGT